MLFFNKLAVNPIVYHILSLEKTIFLKLQLLIILIY
jgi:hypothetical protein